MKYWIRCAAFIAGLFGGVFAAEAQEIKRNCLTEEINKSYIEQFAMPGSARFESSVERYRSSGQFLQFLRTNVGVIKVPVVVHLIHFGEKTGEGSNLSAAQVQSQIEVLNEDFRRMAGTPGYNEHEVGADLEVEFVLAPLDSNGYMMQEAGINRVDARTIDKSFDFNSGLSYSQVENIVKPATIWNPEEYFNIWVVKFDRANSNLLGYATFPYAPGVEGMEEEEQIEQTDGVVIGYTYFGSSDKGNFNLSSPFDKGRTVTHEVGHFMGLLHTWGDGGCLVDDYCEDTPNSSSATFGCPAPRSACDETQEVMIENYMDYTDDACMNVFTLDQKNRVHTVFEISPRRKNLPFSPALSNALSADFYTWNTQVYVNEPLQFADLSEGKIDEWNWTFSGPETLNSIERNPEITFTQAGTYEVTLTVQNEVNSDTMQRTGYILVKNSDPSNQPPTVKQVIPEQLISTGEEKVVDLTQYFEDPEMQPFTFNAFSSDSASVGVNIQGNELSLIGLVFSTVQVSVRADDGNGGYVMQTFDVRVNSTPVAKYTEQQVKVYRNEKDIHIISFKDAFTDIDDEPLAYSLEIQEADAEFVQLMDEVLYIVYGSKDPLQFTLTATDQAGAQASIDYTFAAYDAPRITEEQRIELKTGEKLDLEIADFFSTDDNRYLDYEVWLAQSDKLDVYDNEQGSIKIEALEAGEYVLNFSAWDYLVNNDQFNTNMRLKVVDQDDALLQLLKESTQIYPNPSDKNVLLLFDTFREGEVKVNILDSRGALKKQLMYNKEIMPLTLEIEMKDAPAGIYLIEISFEEYRFIKRFIKI